MITAKIKATGQLKGLKVEGYFRDKTGVPYQEEEIEIINADNTDWESYRKEAIKDFVSAIITREAPQYQFACRNVADRIAEAIMWADELIKQLRYEE